MDPPDLDRGDMVVEDVRGDLLRALGRFAVDLVVGGQVLLRVGHERALAPDDAVGS